MSNNRMISRRGFLQYVGLGVATAVAPTVLPSCAPMNYNDPGILTNNATVRQLAQTRAAYGGEIFFVKNTDPNKEVEGIECKALPGINIEHVEMNGYLSITPTYEKDAKKGMQDFSCTVYYTDGTQETINQEINFTPETNSERLWRIYGWDQAGQSNLRKMVWAALGGENEGKRFEPDDPGKKYLRGLDFTEILREFLTKKGARKEAGADLGQSLGDMIRALPGGKKAHYKCFDEKGILHLRELKGAFESMDYTMHALLDGVSNATEVAAQSVSIDDRMSQGISGTYDTLDGALQAIKDATLVGGGHVRTWQGIIRFTSGKKDNFKEGQLMSETLNTNDYYLDVRYNPLRNTIETVLTVGHDIVAINGLVKALEGDPSSATVAKVVEDPAPDVPGGQPGDGPWWEPKP